jgi:hypothetical protein
MLYYSYINQEQTHPGNGPQENYMVRAADYGMRIFPLEEFNVNRVLQSDGIETALEHIVDIVLGGDPERYPTKERLINLPPALYLWEKSNQLLHRLPSIHMRKLSGYVSDCDPLKLIDQDHLYLDNSNWAAIIGSAREFINLTLDGSAGLEYLSRSEVNELTTFIDEIQRQYDNQCTIKIDQLKKLEGISRAILSRYKIPSRILQEINMFNFTRYEQPVIDSVCNADLFVKDEQALQEQVKMYYENLQLRFGEGKAISIVALSEVLHFLGNLSVEKSIRKTDYNKDSLIKAFNLIKHGYGKHWKMDNRILRRLVPLSKRISAVECFETSQLDLAYRDILVMRMSLLNTLENTIQSNVVPRRINNLSRSLPYRSWLSSLK